MAENKKIEVIDNEKLDEVTGGVVASASQNRGNLKRKFGEKTAKAAATGKARVDEIKGNRI